nr:Rrf2 family transcriptional regulator [Streptococcus vestibularis]
NLLQVYRAVDSIGPSGKLFSFNENHNPAFPVGRNIHGILDQSIEDVQMAMEKELEKKTLACILKDAKANWKEVGA